MRVPKAKGRISASVPAVLLALSTSAGARVSLVTTHSSISSSLSDIRTVSVCAPLADEVPRSNVTTHPEVKFRLLRLEEMSGWMVT
jgi:hypothetical protein